MLNAIFPRPANGRNANAPINPASLALMHWTAEEVAAQQAHYAALRRWYNGEHRIPLTDRQREYLGVDGDFEWALNYLRLPVELMVARLNIVMFEGPAGIGGEDGLLMQWWRANRMDATQTQVHRATAKDGDTYIIVDPPDDEHPYPRYSHNVAYDGTEGVKAHYHSNLRRDMSMASKLWTEYSFNASGGLDVVRRLNLYLPDRVEKYVESGRGWQPHRDKPSEPWPLPWRLGFIPVAHFRWKDNGGNYGESELEDIIPAQMALNKSAIDLLETADKTGAQLLTLTGATWPADAPNVRAGDVLSVSDPAASWGSVSAGDLGQLNENVDRWIVRMAQITQMPLKDFQLTGHISSAATQQADDSQLVARCSSESIPLGNAWEDVARMALLINAEYGKGPSVAPGVDVSARWADFERVDRLAVEERRAGILERLVNAGASIEGALALPALGYSEEEQQAMLQGDVPGVEP